MTYAKGPFVTTLDPSLFSKLAADLKTQGFELSKPLYTVVSGKKKGISCTLYESGKLTVQGKEISDFIEFYLEPELLKSFEASYPTKKADTTPRIGIDESGKGDYFGPLCIAGVYISEENIEKLASLGVKDSKTLTDVTIQKLAKEIQLRCAHHVVKINPKKYNELYTQFKNLNHLLAWGHATTIESLVKETGCQYVIVDQFANERVVETALKRKKLEIRLVQRHRAEEDLCVAAASILARNAFLQGLELLSQQYGIKLPKGASKATIQAGIAFVRKYGKESLENVGKLHFKTTQALL